MANPNINPYKIQLSADGVQVDFNYTFNLVKGRKLNVYKTLNGAVANDIDDLQNENQYTIIPDNPTDPQSPGKVRFAAAPENQAIITITPSNETDVSYTFSNVEQFNADSLNGAFNEVASTLAYDLNNFKASCLRYNYNANNTLIGYDNRYPPLLDNSWHMRRGDKVIAQELAPFVQEVEKLVVVDIDGKVNASVNNVNLSAQIATNPFNTPYSGQVKSIDENGVIVTGPTITGLSALGGAHSAKLWAQDDVEITNDGYGNSGYSAKFAAGVAKDWAQDASQITDVWGNTGYSAKVAAEQSKNWSESETLVNDVWGNSGYSAKHWAEQAATMASAAGGLITDLVHYDDTNPTTRVDLIDYAITPNEPWEKVLPNSMTVYIDGIKLPDPTAYDSSGVIGTPLYTVTTIDEANLSLANPSYITFSPAIDAGKKIQICRSIAQGNSASMLVDSSNAIFTASSKVAGRDLDNVSTVSANANVADKTLSNVATVAAGANVADKTLSNVPSLSTEIKALIEADRLAFFQAACPIGSHSTVPWFNGAGMTWGKIASGRMLVSSDGANAGDHPGTAIEATIPPVDGHALNISEMPAHTHDTRTYADTPPGTFGYWTQVKNDLPGYVYDGTIPTNSTGGGSAHSHNVSWAHYNLELWVRTA